MAALCERVRKGVRRYKTGEHALPNALVERIVDERRVPLALVAGIGLVRSGPGTAAGRVLTERVAARSRSRQGWSG